ncbi:MAG: hypothetical protein ACRDPE_15235 [Solirubrobacterales bacterium]
MVCRAAVQDSLQTDQILHGRSASPLVRSRTDPSTFFGFCCGEGVPRVADELGERVHAHHSFCPVWELEKKRIADRKAMMVEPRRPGISETADAILKGKIKDVDKGDAIEEWLAEDPA